MRLLTYNIRYGGVGRVGALASVVNACAPDVVVLQEATRPEVVRQLAGQTSMTAWASHAGHSVGFMSRVEIAHHQWHRPASSRRAFLEIVPAGGSLRIFGVHLTAVHSNWTERRRVRELRAVLAGIERHQQGFHVIAGDFNTLAPGATLDLGKLPPRLRAVVWVTGRQIRWQTIKIMLDRAYLDAYRSLHRDEPGHTFLAADPHVRLDYVFVPAAWASRLRSCEVVDGHPAAPRASDHLPVLADLDVS
ncbi:MAG TPA: endonuclease/exonuclease/phosphatase family protein [Vicinamibacteria bacterium]|nr:endonuclease/exonuclease/phosphatase family protein [Vicinamibacteria bacterium]